MAKKRAFVAILCVQAVISRPSTSPRETPQINVKLDAEAIWRTTGMRTAFDAPGTLRVPVSSSEVPILTDTRHWHGFSFESFRELLLSYEVYVPANLDFHRHGGGVVLPGIVGRSCSADDDRGRPFTIRLAWSDDGTGHIVLQQFERGTRAKSALTTEVVPGTWSTIGLHAVLATGRGDSAEVELFVNGTQASQWRMPRLNGRWTGVDLSVHSPFSDRDSGTRSPAQPTVSLARFAVSGRLMHSPTLPCPRKSLLWQQLGHPQPYSIVFVTGAMFIILAVFTRRRYRESRRVPHPKI
ncbi:hypothetical protein AURDEDRAFT_170532 [Auricularia subglabra TFB-10046 SS5]|nr:hypothetical protein AURDEDRAFT_170532 [Auricularia subglabra TFB-10046 SS5]